MFKNKRSVSDATSFHPHVKAGSCRNAMFVFEYWWQWKSRSECWWCYLFKTIVKMLRIRSIRFDVMSVTYIPTICVTTSVVWQTSSQRFTGTRLLYLDSSSDTEERLITSLRNVSTITRLQGVVAQNTATYILWRFLNYVVEKSWLNKLWNCDRCESLFKLLCLFCKWDISAWASFV